MSSTHFPRWGYSGDTSMPLRPHLENLYFDPRRVPGWRTLNSGSLSRFGIGWPLRFVNSGLGSHRSTCDGPPYMNKQMQARALAGKCGFRGASGLGTGAAVARPAKKPSWASRYVSAVPTKPPPISQRNSRRLRPQVVR